jgi:hypothetical protein
VFTFGSVTTTKIRTTGSSVAPFTFGAVTNAIYVPKNTTLIDDFNRANGAVNAGAGSTIWTGHGLGSASPQFMNVIGNLAGSTYGGGAQIVSINNMPSNFDLLLDLVTGSTKGFGFIFCAQEANQQFYNAVTVGYDFGSNAWWATQYTGGGSGGSLGSRAGVLPVSGDTYWLAKRGAGFTIYKSSGGGPYTRIANWSCPDWIGAFGFQLYDATQRIDNIRGGPVSVANVFNGVVSAPFTFGATTVPKLPATTYFGSSSAASTFGAVTAATKKTFATSVAVFTDNRVPPVFGKHSVSSQHRSRSVKSRRRSARHSALSLRHLQIAVSPQAFARPSALARPHLFSARSRTDNDQRHFSSVLLLLRSPSMRQPQRRERLSAARLHRSQILA